METVCNTSGEELSSINKHQNQISSSEMQVQEPCRISQRALYLRCWQGSEYISAFGTTQKFLLKKK